MLAVQAEAATVGTNNFQDRQNHYVNIENKYFQVSGQRKSGKKTINSKGLEEGFDIYTKGLMLILIAVFCLSICFAHM